MSERIELTVYAKPTALSRQGRGQFGGQFKTKPTERMIARMVEAWNEAGQPRIPDKSPITLVAIFYFERPKNHYRTGKYSDQLKPGMEDAEPISRPDLTNLVKLIEDALQGYAFDDDARITVAHVEKAYINRGDFARTEIVLRQRGNHEASDTTTDDRDSV